MALDLAHSTQGTCSGSFQSWNRIARDLPDSNHGTLKQDKQCPSHGRRARHVCNHSIILASIKGNRNNSCREGNGKNVSKSTHLADVCHAVAHMDKCIKEHAHMDVCHAVAHVQICHEGYGLDACVSDFPAYKQMYQRTPHLADIAHAVVCVQGCCEGHCVAACVADFELLREGGSL
eukprot:695604-Pelagomonas_calceolata.AAC.3